MKKNKQDSGSKNTKQSISAKGKVIARDAGTGRIVERVKNPSLKLKSIAHVTQNEYDELPEWTDEMFVNANLYIGGKLRRRGRPKSDVHANNISIRLDPKVESYFRALGKGWQSRINSVLKEWVEKHSNA